MNTDLFQSLTVALLGAITILLIGVIATLGRLRRSVEANSALLKEELARPASTPQQPTESPEPEVAETEPAQAEVAAAADDARPAEGRERSEEPATGAVAAPADASAAEDRDEREADHARSAETGEDEPQEQPYERDGRWWFRRGEELLVYDEQTGQWLQVESPANATYAGYAGTQAAEGSAGTVATESRTSTLAAESAVESQEGSSEGSRSFWKCPSCGAINGATASSCRMCFSARP